MFVRATLSKIFQLPNDHIFGRRENQSLAAELSSLCVSKCPGMKFIATCRVKIGFEACFHVDEVEATSLFAGDFNSNDFEGRHVELIRIKSALKTSNVITPQEHDEIDIMCEARFPIRIAATLPLIIYLTSSWFSGRINSSERSASGIEKNAGHFSRDLLFAPVGVLRSEPDCL
jgi:hypothetical protein